MARFQLMLIFFLCYILSSSSASTGISTNKLVEKVCNQTSNYTFCVEALYSDPRTPTVDAYGLAFVSFGMAYLNATATQDYIAMLLNDSTSAASHKRRLKVCQLDYRKAVSALEEAYDDLNSETFFQLAELAGRATAAADNCQSAFKGTHYSPLSTMNDSLKSLSYICIIVSKFFTGGNF